MKGSPPTPRPNDIVPQRPEAELPPNGPQLQQAAAHAELSTAEWRATNEALQAMNAQLQSMNEELNTVNDELRLKIQEYGKANDDLHNLIASADIAAIFVDKNLRIKRFTPRVTDIFCIVPSDLDRSLLDLAHELEYEDLASDVATTFAALHPVEREVRHHNGRYYIVRLLPYRTTENIVDGAIMTFFDATRVREAEARARVGEERMRLVAECTRDYAIITMDTDGNIVSWNKGAERVFGYTEAEIVGQSCDLIFTQEDRALGVPYDEQRRALKDGRAEDERWHLRKDGSRFYCSGVMTPLIDNDRGQLYGYAKIARDQTRRVELESQREAALNEEQLGRWNAETSSALKDQFLAIMSHELRHPLNLIHINIELLSRLQLLQESPLGRKAVAVIRNSVQSQAKIIEDLLDMSRLNTGKLTLVKVPVDLAMLVNSIAEVLQADTERNGITIMRSGTDEPVMVMADSVRIEQVILNLLSNAFKFTPAGGTVTISLTRDSHEARLEVIDTGQGISADALSGIFDMFSQAGPTASRSKSGLGIGLALVRQIAELHEGRVKATSDGAGKGACFSLWLPLANGADQKTEAIPQMLEKIAGVCILLVDDSEDMVTAFKTLLEMEGARVLVATDAKTGLVLVAKEKVDLLISDISMPEMNGYQFIENVRQLPQGRNLPAIALSGLSREQDIVQCYQAGFSAHFNKPIALEKLTKTIIALLRPAAAMDDSG